MQLKLLVSICAFGLLALPAAADDREGRHRNLRQWQRVGTTFRGGSPGYAYYRGVEWDRDSWKDSKEWERARREAWRERHKDRREAWREAEKDRREAEREWRKAEQEAWREDQKARAEWLRERDKAYREAVREGFRRN